ncbi:MAG TPA: undecaprenyl-phosphate glucose phosphotransferase [Chitinophaga sp.]|uniref:undecaprenyl-phosphate glucose phosphotransferase n=1 Tax=Chitinophaga sp. TaxID=1869181 RepID=UPI002F925EB7
MKWNTDVSYYIRLLIDYVVLTLFFLCTRRYIAGQGDVFFSSFNWLLLGISLIAWTIIGISVHLYDDFRTRPFSIELVAILKTVLIHACFLTFLFFYFFKYYPYPRTFTLLYNLLVFSGMVIVKYIVKKSLLRLQIMGYNTKNVLIVGTGDMGMNFYRTILDNEHFGYRCVGFVDEQTNTHLNGQFLGTLPDLKRILEEHDIDDVVVAMPGGLNEQLHQIIVMSEQEAKRVRIIADCYNYCTTTASMHLCGNLPLLTIRSSPLDDPARQRLKRFFDVTISILLFISMFSWLFPLIALLIKLTSKGPVLYKQERWGLKNQKITCYKFRSMVQDCDMVDANGRFLQATPNDKRITPIGKLLRKSSLDELPQFINVLRGDMTLVGPRPHAIPLHMESKQTIQRYMLRHLVKPGITGWAQVNGCRGETRLPEQMQKRVDLDLWYIENYSCWLDCQIILQTCMNMIKGDKQAY